MVALHISITRGPHTALCVLGRGVKISRMVTPPVKISFGTHQKHGFKLLYGAEKISRPSGDHAFMRSPESVTGYPLAARPLSTGGSWTSSTV